MGRDSYIVFVNDLARATLALDIATRRRELVNDCLQIREGRHLKLLFLIIVHAALSCCAIAPVVHVILPLDVADSFPKKVVNKQLPTMSLGLPWIPGS